MAKIRAIEVRNFIWENIICRYGIPAELISDNRKQFDGREIIDFCEEYKIKHNFSTPNYPQANGQVEQTNRTLLEALKERLNRSKGLWVEELPGEVWAYRTTTKRATRETPYSLVYGVEAVLPVEVKHPTYRQERLNEVQNYEGIDEALEGLEDKREMVNVRIKVYQARVKRYFDKKVKKTNILCN